MILHCILEISFMGCFHLPWVQLITSKEAKDDGDGREWMNLGFERGKRILRCWERVCQGNSIQRQRWK